MAVGHRSISDPERNSTVEECPEIAACRSTPETTVFLEDGNTDGWIASTLTVPVGD